MTHTPSLGDHARVLADTIRCPESLVTRWAHRLQTPEAPPSPLIFPLLLAMAIVGVAIYGVVMHVHGGAGAMAYGALALPGAAGLAWSLSLPSLYIIKRIGGSTMDHSTLTLVALTTVCFGSLAMLASVPVTLFFYIALPYEGVRIAANLVVFCGVGACMGDVLMRTLRAVEPHKTQIYPVLWLGLLSLLGAELMWLLGVFDL